jgi:hypothetical protein
MTTALGPGPEPAVPPGARSVAHRRSDRRKRSLEKVLAALLLLVALAVTVVLLGLQWLGNQGTTSSASISASHTFTSEVQPS